MDILSRRRRADVFGGLRNYSGMCAGDHETGRDWPDTHRAYDQFDIWTYVG